MSKKKRGVRYTRQKFPKKMQKKLVMLFGAIILAFVFFNWKNYVYQCSKWRKIYKNCIGTATV